MNYCYIKSFLVFNFASYAFTETRQACVRICSKQCSVTITIVSNNDCARAAPRVNSRSALFTPSCIRLAKQDGHLDHFGGGAGNLPRDVRGEHRERCHGAPGCHPAAPPFALHAQVPVRQRAMPHGHGALLPVQDQPVSWQGVSTLLVDEDRAGDTCPLPLPKKVRDQ